MSESIPQLKIQPGSIRADYIPKDWPLTPLGANKDPYVRGWQANPLTVDEVVQEINRGNCKAIGLLGGPVFNLPYGLLWVDIDGPSVYSVVEELAAKPAEQALTDTLTICSGREGRERRLYKVPKSKFEYFSRNKYSWYGETAGEKLEVLWKKHQGVLMGHHPKTKGYYTPDGLGFEWAERLPEVPEWLLNAIVTKNKKLGKATNETTRIVGQSFALNQHVDQDRENKKAVEAMYHLPPEHADEYETWITVGQVLHSLDDSLLEEWDKWSQQSDKYQPGACHRKWKSFDRNGGVGLGTLIHEAKKYGYTSYNDEKVMPLSDEELEMQARLLNEINEDVPGETRKVNRESPKPSEGKTKKSRQSNKPTPNEVADILLQMYKGNLRYDPRSDKFFLYNFKHPGLWSKIYLNELQGDVIGKLRSLGDFLPGWNAKFVEDLISLMRAEVTFVNWYEGKEYLLFSNGVLDVEKMELLPFDKSYNLIHRLPYPYDSEATCCGILDFLSFTQHDDNDRVQVLRAFLRAILLGHYECQRFVEIIGPGKTGKSTFANLAVALVGKTNAFATDFNNMESNRFELAQYLGKKLLLLQDQDRWGGSVAKLKSITGGDWLRAENKYQKEQDHQFQYRGLVIITANETIQTTDYTTGLQRRRITIPFDRVYQGSSAQQAELIGFDGNDGDPYGPFAEELPGLVNWLLDMTEQQMKEYLMETNKNCKFLNQYHTAQMRETNPVMSWLADKVVFAPGEVTLIGSRRLTKNNEERCYKNSDIHLYASYLEHTEESYTKGMSRTRFAKIFSESVVNQLKFDSVQRTEVKAGYLAFSNVVLRTGNARYSDYPSIVDVAADREKYRSLYGDLI